MNRLVTKILVLVLSAFSIGDAFAQHYVENSVLNNGTIYKIGVVGDGMYRITYDELAALGVDVASLNLDKISVFGNVAGMLPEANDADCYDDLAEMNIITDDTGIVFYGQDAAVWNYTNGHYTYVPNHYSDTTFYFLKIDNQQDGKRMARIQQPQGEPAGVVDAFVDKQYHDVDLHNHYHRGRKWYGEEVSGDNPILSVPFVFKNADATHNGYLTLSFIGASKSEDFVVRCRVNGEQAGADVQVKKAGQYNYGSEYSLASDFVVTGDENTVQLEVIAQNASSFAGIDYIALNVWRSLIYNNEQLQYSLTRIGHPTLELVSVDNASADMTVYDVSNPLSPEILDFTVANGKIQYKAYIEGQKSYIVAKDTDYQNVSVIKRIANQNLHAIDDADMLIITDKIFEVQAVELKAIHEEVDGLDSKVVFLDEIYNEFSSGSPDITGMRNFIRMVYQRSDNLKYVMLLGRGTNDYKNVEKYNNNFIPPYEAENVVNEIYAYVSDDYYGLMDDNEGEACYGLMDLGVGRIPVVTPDEAAAVVSKIRRYIDFVKNRGGWRNNVLFVADDKTKEYARSLDNIEKLIESMKPSINVDKVYSDAYVRKAMSGGGYYYPEATEAILNKFSEGVMMMAYLGHGGVKGLSASNILRINDINKMDNYYRMPFVATGTCEFSAFDDATFISAGERMFTMEGGGAIGMFTTTRPTTATVNAAIMKNFFMHILEGDNLRTLRFGDMIRLTKDDNVANTSNYLSYVFFGDPALRFDYPQKDVVVTKINDGMPSGILEVAPMDSVRVEGYVSDGHGAVDVGFNGYLYPKMFDNKSPYKTLNNQGVSGNIYSFSVYDGVVYEGKVSVKNGIFSFTYLIPKTVNNHSAAARLSLYAVDTANMCDANGFMQSITIGGVPTASVDHEGPSIQLLWNDQDVVNGEVPNHGTLTAKIHDKQGIYHYNTAIGRDLMLYIDSESRHDVMVVNKLYEQDEDDFTSGSFSIELNALEVGHNTFTVRAWDTHDNGNKESITITVTNNTNVKIKNVMNYPNPFSDKTCIIVEYDKPGVRADVDVVVYDIAGRAVKSLSYKDLNVPVMRMEWDGCDDFGRRLLSGVYIYKVYVKDTDGNEFTTTQRMIIIR